MHVTLLPLAIELLELLQPSTYLAATGEQCLYIILHLFLHGLK